MQQFPGGQHLGAVVFDGTVLSHDLSGEGIQGAVFQAPLEQVRQGFDTGGELFGKLDVDYTAVHAKPVIHCVVGVFLALIAV